jgi:glycosyltransferase involved in cell wall biosynthesis
MQKIDHSQPDSPTSAQRGWKELSHQDGPRADWPKLLVAIPALNEEDSIESIIQRSLDARDTIIRNSRVRAVDITVVSDGSTDRTVELASRYTDQIKLIVFEQNKGYGAAIKEAWMQSDADLLGFLDADGTCDPQFFSQLCATLQTEEADVVLGSRMGPGSKMPPVRRVGNVLFAVVLSMFSSRVVRDTASGMRVIRRSSLPRLLPLPDGLNFTPAMSARSLLSEDLKIVEIPMSYHERQGESKLRVGKDGMRFLKVILESAFLYRPSRPLALAGICCLTIACLLMLTPILYYIQNHSVLEWMIYRFIVSSLLGTASFLLFSASYLTGKIVGITLSSKPVSKLSEGFVSSFFASRLFWPISLLPMVIGGLLVVPSFVELVKTGATYEHWSRFVAMSFLFQVSLILIVTRIADYALGLLAQQLRYLRAQQP